MKGRQNEFGYELVTNLGSACAQSIVTDTLQDGHEAKLCCGNGHSQWLQVECTKQLAVPVCRHVVAREVVGEDKNCTNRYG